jgi:hypothetical protein
MNPDTVSPSGKQTELSLARIASHWITEMGRGHVLFTPDEVFTRSVYDATVGIEFKLIFNAARAKRGQAKAA